ncbi:hypothetical protein MKZ38_003042 [Zalerion maritima]|uniref:Uncharacterized protein n=1 Tax=Zalerion maritima TaxID=339359 RepID=A0AAD5WRZ6_9PEZI|nr:hypothetical protein MKZ38_003042 [Zalerion maritima]
MGSTTPSKVSTFSPTSPSTDSIILNSPIPASDTESSKSLFIEETTDKTADFKIPQDYNKLMPLDLTMFAEAHEGKEEIEHGYHTLGGIPEEAGGPERATLNESFNEGHRELSEIKEQASSKSSKTPGQEINEQNLEEDLETECIPLPDSEDPGSHSDCDSDSKWESDDDEEPEAAVEAKTLSIETNPDDNAQSLAEELDEESEETGLPLQSPKSTMAEKDSTETLCILTPERVSPYSSSSSVSPKSRKSTTSPKRQQEMREYSPPRPPIIANSPSGSNNSTHSHPLTPLTPQSPDTDSDWVSEGSAYEYEEMPTPGSSASNGNSTSSETRCESESQPQPEEEEFLTMESILPHLQFQFDEITSLHKRYKASPSCAVLISNLEAILNLVLSYAKTSSPPLKITIPRTPKPGEERSLVVLWHLEATLPPQSTDPALACFLRIARRHGNCLASHLSLTSSLSSSLRRFYLSPALRDLRSKLDSNLSRNGIPKVLFLSPCLSHCTEFWDPSLIRFPFPDPSRPAQPRPTSRPPPPRPACRLDPTQTLQADHFQARHQMFTLLSSILRPGAEFFSGAGYYTAPLEGWIGFYMHETDDLMDELEKLAWIEEIVLDKESHLSIWRNPFTGAAELAGSSYFPAPRDDVVPGKKPAPRPEKEKEEKEEEEGEGRMGSEAFLRGIDRMMDRYRVLSDVVGNPALDRWELKIGGNAYDAEGGYEREGGCGCDGVASCQGIDTFMSKREILEKFGVHSNARQAFYCPNLRLE